MAKIKDKRQIEKKMFEIYIIDKELTFVRTITVKKNPHSRNMDKNTIATGSQYTNKYSFLTYKN